MNPDVSTNTEAQAGPQRGPSALLVWAPMLVAFASLWPTFLALSHRWNVDAGGSHGWLIGPVCLWLIWLAHKDYRNVDYRPSLLAAVLLLGAVVATLFFRAASVELLEALAALTVIWLAAVTVLGWRWGWLLAFPVGYLLFAIPIWDYAIPLLQRMTVAANGVMIRLADMPAYIHGNFVDVPSGTFHIEGGCAGSHYFMTAMALATLYCHLHFRSWRPRLYLLAAMIALAAMGNWIRVFMVIYAGYVTQMQHPWVTEDHYTLGWVIFGVTLIPFFLIGRWLERYDTRDTPQATAAMARGAAPSRAQGLPAAASVALAAALLLVPPATVYTLTASQPATGPLDPPVGTAAWEGPIAVLRGGQPDDWHQGAAHPWHPSFAGVTAETQAAYASASVGVEVYLNWYARQGQGAELIGYSAVPEGRGYEPRAQRGVEAGGAAWRLIEVQRGGDSRLVAVRYRLGSRPLVSAWQAKLWQGLGGLMGRTGGGAIAVSVSCTPDCATAEPMLMQFLKDMNDSLDAAMDRAAQGNDGAGGKDS